MNKPVKIVLFASIILNVAFAGMFLGHLSHRFLSSHMHHFSAELLAQLPQDKRKLFEDTVHAAWADMDSTRAQLGDARKEAARLMKAEPFNEEAYLTQMQHVNVLQAQLKTHMSEAMARIAGQFTPEERAVLADIIVSRPADMIHTGADKH